MGALLGTTSPAPRHGEPVFVPPPRRWLRGASSFGGTAATRARHGDVGTLPASPSLLCCPWIRHGAEASPEGWAVMGTNWVLAGVFESLAAGRFSFPTP